MQLVSRAVLLDFSSPRTNAWALRESVAKIKFIASLNALMLASKSKAVNSSLTELASPIRISAQ